MDLAVAGSNPVTHPFPIAITMQRQWKWVWLVALAVVTPACNRTVLNEETTLDVRPGDLKSLKIDPAPREQKIRVELTSTPAPVSVFVFLEKDRATAMHDIEARKDPPANVLEYREKINNATLEVTIPADSVAEVLVTHASKSTKVTLKLTN